MIFTGERTTETTLTFLVEADSKEEAARIANAYIEDSEQNPRMRVEINKTLKERMAEKEHVECSIYSSPDLIYDDWDHVPAIEERNVDLRIRKVKDAEPTRYLLYVRFLNGRDPVSRDNLTFKELANILFYLSSKYELHFEQFMQDENSMIFNPVEAYANNKKTLMYMVAKERCD